MKRLILLFLCTLASAQVTNYARMLSGVNYQSGTTYIFQAVDSTRVTQFSNAAAVAATLAAGSTTGFQAGTVFTARNNGVGTVTITCSGCTINGSGTLALGTGQAVDIYSDGLNYVAFVAGSAGSVASVFGRTGTVTAQSGDYTCGQVTGCPPATAGYYVLGNGLVCDGVTDDTAALNTLLATVNTNGGGSVIFPQGKTCLFNSAEITIPNNADSWTDGTGTISSQAPVHWTCDAGNVQYQQLMSTGATLSQIQNACVIDLEFNAADAKIVSLGLGHWEVDHISFVDKNTDCAPFFLFTNTIPDIHDNAFIGSTKSVTSGPYSCNDILTFGGAGATQPCKVVGCWFQGYAGARVANNFFNQVKRAVLMNNAAQTIMVFNNTVWSQSGCSTCGPFEIPGSSVYGNTFSYNNIETVHYLYGLNITGGAVNTLVVGQTCSDTSEFSTLCVRTTGTDIGTLVIGGSAPAGSMISASDVNTSAFIFNSGGSLWKNTFHWNAFMNLIDQTTSPIGLLNTSGFFSQASTQRLAFSKWHQTTLFHVAATEDLPTSQNSVATDNFTRANSGSLGANWTAITGLTGLAIASNTAQTQTAAGAYEGDFYSASTFPNDQYSQCTIGTLVVNTNNFVGCAVRIQSAANSWYAILMTTDGSTLCAIRKMTAGVISTLQACTAGFSSTNTTLSAGDVLLITIVGTTITAYKNNIQLATTTDASFTTGSPGLVGFPSSAAAAITWSSWAGGAMECAGAVTGFGPLMTTQCGGPISPGSTVQKSESGADTNVLTFATSTTPGVYQVNFTLSVATATAAVLGWTATWTDSNGNAQTPTNLSFIQTGTAAPAGTFTTSAAGDYHGTAIVDTNNSGTNIVVKLTLGSGSFTGKASASVVRLQ